VSEPLRIANCSGFYGDRLSAAREMVEGGPIDVLTGDYLAELTLAILLKDRMRDPDLGYAKTFLQQLEEVAGACLERGIKIVVNAGGLNPAGLAQASRALYTELGLRAVVAHIEGDDVRPLLERLQAEGEPLAHLDKGTPLSALDASVLSANAYLGGMGIARSCVPASPTRPSPSAPPCGASAGRTTTGIAWPPPSSRGTSSSAARSARAATTRSSKRCRSWRTPAFPSPRSARTARSR
jgi:hypothetical protein